MLALWLGVGVLVSLGGLALFLVGRYGPEVLGREVPGSRWLDLLWYLYNILPIVLILGLCAAWKLLSGREGSHILPH